MLHHTKAGCAYDVNLHTGSRVSVTWWGTENDSPPSPQWFVGQARRYGGRLRLMHKGTQRTPWNGDVTVVYTFHREPTDR